MNDDWDNRGGLGDDESEIDEFDHTQLAPGFSGQGNPTPKMEDSYDEEARTEIVSFDSIQHVSSRPFTLSDTDDEGTNSLQVNSDFGRSETLPPGNELFGVGGSWGDENDAPVPDTFPETNAVPIQEDDKDVKKLETSIDGRFELLGLLGEGAMGRVYRAKQLSVGRDVAIKLLKKDIADQPEIRERFLREAQLISGFSHPNIVRLVDFGETSDGQLFLAMEFINGKPLGDLFAGKKLAPEYALEAARQVASALIESHEQGVVHRDLKPDNIFLARIADSTAQYKVLDFGVARTSSSGLTQTGMVYGTPTYMAPEQAKGETVGDATDLYAIGCMLFELLTGSPPFEGQPLQVMMKHVSEPPPNLLDLAPHLPNDVIEVVNSLLAKDPNERIGSAIALCDTLEHVMTLNGWNRTYRLPAGPLLETTKEWHLSVKASSQQFGGVAFDPVAGRKTGGPRKAGKPAASRIPEPKFEKLELDRPTPAPAPRATSQPMRAQASARSTTESRPVRVRAESRPSNTPYIVLLVVLLALAGGIGALILQRSEGGGSIAPQMLATGSAKTVFEAVRDSGWTLSSTSSMPMGEISLQSVNASRGEATVNVSVFKCNGRAECHQVFTDTTRPTVAYLIDTLVIQIEPKTAAVSRADIQQLFTTATAEFPGGALSSE